MYVDAHMLSCINCVQIFVILWTVDPQAPLFMGFFRQEYWRGMPCPSQGDLPNPGIEHISPASNVLVADSLPTELPEKSHLCIYVYTIYIYI